MVTNLSTQKLVFYIYKYIKEYIRSAVMEKNNHSEPFVFLFGRNLLHRQLTDKTKTYRKKKKKGLPDHQSRKDVLKCR